MIGTTFWKNSSCDYINVSGQAIFYINTSLYSNYNCDTNHGKTSKDCVFEYGIGTNYTYEIYVFFTFR